MNQAAKSALLLASAGMGAWLLFKTAQRRPRYDFRDKVVVITGGSRGLGIEITRLLAAEGARLAVCARDREELDRARGEFQQHGVSLFTHECDITIPEQVERFAAAVESNLGSVDVLINNAGIISVGPLSTMTRHDFEESMAINFWGAYNTIEAFLPGMRSRRAGRIVNISSIGGKIAVPHLLPYSASKFALVGYSHGLRAELASEGITVTTVCPGLMRTGSPRNALFKGNNEAEYAWFSISDSLPFLTISSEEAAREVIEACRRGDSEVVISLPAKIAVRLQSLFPELFSDLLGLAQRLLPGSDGKGTATHRGSESASWASPSPLTTLTEAAARKNNEFAQ